MKKTSKTQIAQNYATALYDAAVSDNVLETVFNNCQDIEKTLNNVEHLDILNNPELRFNQKKEILSAIADKLKISKTVENFLITLAENNRFGDLNAIFSRFYQIYYKKQEMMEVLVQSVQPLNAEQQEKLSKNLEKKLKQKLVINYKINPDILGGLVVEIGSNIIDDSIKGKLNRLEQVMKGNV